METDPILVALGTFLGTTVGVGSILYVRHRIIFGSAKERERREEIKRRTLRSLDALVTVGEMNRLWYDWDYNCYNDNIGKQVSTQPLRQDLNILKSYNPEGLMSLVAELDCTGKTLNADAYSLSDAKDIHGEYTFGVLYHRLQEVGSKPELRIVDSAVKSK